MHETQKHDGDQTGRAEAQAAVGRLGTGLLAAGYAMTDVAEILRQTFAAQRWSGMNVGVLPGAVLVDDASRDSARVINAAPGSFDFSQSAQIAILAQQATTSPMTAQSLSSRVRATVELPRRYPPALAAVGSGLMSGGIAVVFQTTMWAVVVDALLGLVVGFALVVGAGRFARVPLTPFVTAFGVAAIVYALAPVAHWGPTTLYVVCAPLVILIPGATITTAVLELAAGEVVSGGGRFVSGLLAWLTLAVAIAAGAAITGQPINGPPIIATGAPILSAPPWLIPVALIAMAVGIGLFFNADPALMAVIAVVLLLTYGIVAAASLFTPNTLASGIAAAIMLPLCRLLERNRPRWPLPVTYRPAFWLLVPGSLGLVTLSQTSPVTDPVAAASQVGVTVVAIAVGVQVGGLLSAPLKPRNDE